MSADRRRRRLPPGVAQTYTATEPAVVTSTAGDAALGSPTLAIWPTDRCHAAAAPLQVELSGSAFSGPVTGAPVTVASAEPIAGTDALRTGTLPGR